MIDICMIRQPEAQILDLPEESNIVANAIQPNGGYNLLYDPHSIQQRAIAVGDIIGQLTDQNSRYDRIDTIEDESFQRVAQTRLADMQTETLADLEQIADRIPYEGIGQDLVRLSRRRRWLADRLAELNQRQESSTAAIREVLHQVDDVLGFRDELAWLLASQRLDECDWRFDAERNDIEPALRQATKDEVAVAALYRAIAAPWPAQHIRYPEKPPVIPANLITRPTSPGPERAPIGDRGIHFTIPPEIEAWSSPINESLRQPSWESPPQVDFEEHSELEEPVLCDEWFDTLNRNSPPQVEPEYDPRFDLVLHELNGTTPPKTAQEIATENIKILIDELRDPQTSLEDLTLEFQEKLTQHERIAAFLIARAGQTLTGLDIGKFLFTKSGEELDVALAVNKARTLMGPQAHGKKVLKAMSPFDYAIQYGSKEVKANGRIRTMRLYRGLHVAVTVLPETLDPAITWEPFTPN